jgi:hypothetical protein
VAREAVGRRPGLANLAQAPYGKEVDVDNVANQHDEGLSIAKRGHNLLERQLPHVCAEPRWILTPNVRNLTPRDKVPGANESQVFATCANLQFGIFVIAESPLNDGYYVSARLANDLAMSRKRRAPSPFQTT